MRGCIAVRQILEQDVSFRGQPIYSPERAYQIGDVLNFLTSRGVRRGLVLHVDAGRSAPIDGVDLAYDGICVRFKDQENLRLYVSNCPNYPLRYFSYKGAAHGGTPHEQLLTPGQLVMRFGELILPSVQKTLADDLRFCTFDGEEWMLMRFLTYFDEGMTRGIIANLRESGGSAAEKLCELALGTGRDATDRASTAFSLSYHLKNDPLHRFAMSRTNSNVIWALTPPPKQVVCTLDGEMTAAGRIRVSGDFQKIVDFYGLTSVLQMQAYGGYSLKGIYDPELRLIYGDDLRLWMEENGLSLGHRVYIKSPISLGAPLVLFSELEIHQSPELGEPAPQGHTRLFLRHKIYLVLIQAQEWLHYREISERLKKSGFEVQSPSVIAALSSNKHLFCRREPAQGLWGLTRWLEQAANYPVNLQSLSITIREEQWVHKILREEGAPLSPKEVVRRLSEIFGVGIGTMRELTIIDGTDPAIGQLRDGRLLLRAWIPQWEGRLKECEKVLTRCQDLRDLISTCGHDLNACQRKLQPIDDLIAGQLAVENDLSKKVSQLRKEIGAFRSEFGSSSKSIGALESELASLEKRCRKLAGWRKIGVASYSLAAVCLMIRAPVVVPAFAMLGSTAGCISIYRRLSAARRKVRSKRDQLDTTTASAVATSRRLGKAQEELSLAEKEYTAVRDTCDRLATEQESLRCKVKESSDTLLALEVGFGQLQESKVVDERALLLELLGAFAEVEHGRPGQR